DGTLIRREGKMGQEVEIPLLRKTETGKEKSLVEPSKKHLQVNPFTCREYDPSTLVIRPGENRRALPLLDGHGVIEYNYLGYVNENNPILYKPQGGTERMLPTGEIIHYLDFYEFDNLYTLGYKPPNVPKPERAQVGPHIIYAMNPRGEISKFEIPPGPWVARGISKIALTKKGPLFITVSVKNERDVGNAGDVIP
ncbi:MAG: hypothetical protein ACREUA_06525, partial [Burkholderiales bacterium]